MCVKDVKPSDIYDDLRSTLGETVKRTLVFQWAKRLRKSRASTKDNPRHGRPQAASKNAIKKVTEIILIDRRVT